MDSEHANPTTGNTNKVPEPGDSGVCTRSVSSQLRKGSTQISLGLESLANAAGSGNTNSNKRGSIAGTSADAGNAYFQPFVPDYTVKAVSDVIYAKITRSTYLVSFSVIFSIISTSGLRCPFRCDYL